MVAIKNFLLFAATAAAGIIPRDAAKVLADLKTINTDTNNLNTAVKNWDGTTFGAASIQSSEQTLESAISSATTDANNSAAASETDAQSIISYITGTLEPSIKTAINTLNGRYSNFKSAGLQSTVKSDLSSLKSKTDSLGSALIAKAPSDKKAAAQSALNSIDADLNSGISKFNS